MTGIFPSNGVAAGNTSNALTNPNLASGVEAKWYAERCNPRMNAAAMNALMSEILGALDAAGISYDPSRLDNFSRAVAATSTAGLTNEMNGLMAAAGLTYDATRTDNLSRAVLAIAANGGAVGTISTVGKTTELFSSTVNFTNDSALRNWNMSLSEFKLDEFTFDGAVDELTCVKAGTYLISWNGDVRLAWDGTTGTNAEIGVGYYENDVLVVESVRTAPSPFISPDHLMQYFGGSATRTLAAGAKLTIKHRLTGGQCAGILNSWKLVRTA